MYFQNSKLPTKYRNRPSKKSFGNGDNYRNTRQKMDPKLALYCNKSSIFAKLKHCIIFATKLASFWYDICRGFVSSLATNPV